MARIDVGVGRAHGRGDAPPEARGPTVAQRKPASGNPGAEKKPGCSEQAGFPSAEASDDDYTLVELLDRLLHTGVVLCGDVTISVADIDLAYLRLQLVLSSVETARQAGWYRPTQPAAGAPAAAPVSSLANEKRERV